MEDRRNLAPRIVRLDAATGKATELVELPQEYGTEGNKARVFERDGSIIIMPWTSVASKHTVVYLNTTAASASRS